MNIRLLIGVGLGLVAVLSPNALAFQTSHDSRLPNYDARKATGDSLAGANAQPNLLQSQAGAALSARVPGLRLSQDGLLGTPRLVSASRGFLTAAGGAGGGLSPASLRAVPAGDPHRVIKAFVNENSALFGHDADAFVTARIKTDAVTAHSGLRTVIWQQQLDDLPVYGGLFVGHLTRKEQLVSVSDRFVPDLVGAAAAISGRTKLLANPPISAAEAVSRAAGNLGQLLPVKALQAASAPEGAGKHQAFEGVAGQLRGSTPVQLVWLPLGRNQLQLCWQVILTVQAQPGMYLVLVNAQTGRVLLRHGLTTDISDATYRVYTSDSPTPFSPGWPTRNAGQPPEVARTLVTFPALSTNASPNGWINDGVNETLGNNVDAHLDANDDNQPDLPRPQGAPNRVFDFPLDLTTSPDVYGKAAVVNLFYWNNFAHDKMYELGFTEPFGNFQNNNFDRGGMGGDAVQADAQDGGGFDNANFSTPPDGYPGRMQMYVFSGPNPDRDGDLDAEIMIHEYTHGLSNRLLGGGVGIFRLQPSGMGEGWSDFYGLAMLSETTDDPHGNYAAGGYATYQLDGLSENYYFGIRRYPYTTDMSKNPLTLKDIDPTKADPHAGVPINPIFGGSFAAEVHNQGEVWCVTLWEARANLIDSLGPVAGNQTILRLVTDGLKLAPENATFLEARDGILKADEVLTGGANLSDLWLAFAKRGMGYSASVPTSDTTRGVQEAYDLPDFVSIDLPNGIMEVRVTPQSGSALFAGSTEPIFVRITDGITSVTNATIAASLSTGGSLTFRNDGVSPDASASNAIYSANFNTPASPTNVTLTLVITAAGKDTSTNMVSYTIIPTPPNDNFTNSIKVPANGATYLSNNKLATTETNEPPHAGVNSSFASLWWSFTPTNTGSVLIDTAGSAFNTLLAVYTGNSLTGLQAVVSADDVGTRRQAFVFLNAQAGQTYRVAVAGYDAISVGSLRLAFVPGGTPDTNAPTVTVSSPLSGTLVLTNRVVLSGTAFDPDPSPSGLQEIRIRVNPGLKANGAGDGGSGGTTASLISTNWTMTAGLFAGVNVIEVTVTDVAGNRSAPVVRQVTYIPLDPPNDIFANAIPLTGNGTNSVNTLNATKEVGEPNHAGNGGGKSAWWNYTSPVDGLLTLSTSNSTFDTVLAVYTGPNVQSLTLVADNDDAFAGAPGNFSRLTLGVVANQVYHIAVDGFDGAAGVVFLRYNFAANPLYHVTINSTPGGTTAPGSLDATNGSTVLVTAIPAPGYVFDLWDGDSISYTNPLPVLVNSNRNLLARFVPAPFTEDFETGGLRGLGWTSAGSAPWFVQTNGLPPGRLAARSGQIGNSQASSMIISGTNFLAGNGSFALRVSSEANFDFLGFYVNGILQQQWSGELSWTSYGFPLNPGTNTLEWRYTKDVSTSSGEDAAFIDNINIPLNGGRQYLRRLLNGTYYVDVWGAPGQAFTLQGSSDLLNWANIASGITASNLVHIIDPASQTELKRFYRMVPQP